MSEPTPGPWEVYDRWYIRSVHAPQYSGAHAEVKCSPHVPVDREAEHEANAKLIAAAPDLLAALIPFAKFACDEPCGCHNCAARAAIAKARE